MANSNPRASEIIQQTLQELSKEAEVYEFLATKKPGYIEGFGAGLRAAYTKLQLGLVRVRIVENTEPDPKGDE